MEQLLIVASLTLMWSISPWPDFVLVMKNNLLYWKAKWILTAIWVWLWVLVHATYCIAWLALIISKSILLFNIIKWIWAIYLFYLWIMLLRSKKPWEVEIKKLKESQTSWLKCLSEWFICNVLNPKATVFFLAIFTQVISANTILIDKIIMWLLMSVIVWWWFIALSFIIDLSYIKKRMTTFQLWVERTMWILLCFLWLKIILSK